MGCPNQVRRDWECVLPSRGARCSRSEVQRKGPTRFNWFGHTVRRHADPHSQTASAAAASAQRRVLDTLTVRPSDINGTDTTLLAWLGLLAREIGQCV